MICCDTVQHCCQPTKQLLSFEVTGHEQVLVCMIPTFISLIISNDSNCNLLIMRTFHSKIFKFAAYFRNKLIHATERLCFSSRITYRLEQSSNGVFSIIVPRAFALVDRRSIQWWPYVGHL